MEESGAMSAKKVWSIIRALYFMFRKNKSKKNHMQLHLSMIMKRGKLAGKAFRDLILHHPKDVITTVDHHHSSDVLPGEYIYSCRDTPLFSLSRTRNRFFSCAHALSTKEEDDDECVNVGDMKVLEIVESAAVSPAPPGVGRSRVVIRMVEPWYCSPREVHEDDSRVVDEAAEEFIIKFYKDLKKQNLVLFN